VRHRYVIGVVAALGLAVAGPARAALYEGFDYPPSVQLAGQTNPQTGQQWAYVGTGLTNSLDPTTAPGGLTYAGFPDSTGNSVITNRSQTGASRLSLPAGVTSGTVYYSMLVRVNDLTGLTNTTTGSFFAGLNNGTGPGASITQGGALLMIHLDPDTAEAYNLGVAVNPANADRIFEETARILGETLLVVGAYEFKPGADNDVAYLWINPASDTFGADAPPPPTVTSDGAVSVGTASDIPLGQLVSVFLRNNSVEPQTIQVDELRVDTTWAGVTTIPEPGAIAPVMMVLGGLARARRRNIRRARFSERDERQSAPATQENSRSLKRALHIRFPGCQPPRPRAPSPFSVPPRPTTRAPSPTWSASPRITGTKSSGASASSPPAPTPAASSPTCTRPSTPAAASWPRSRAPAG
jgi:hypothetical protein